MRFFSHVADLLRGFPSDLRGVVGYSDSLALVHGNKGNCLMKALDPTLLKSLRDNNYDPITGRALSRDVDNALRYHLEDKPKMTVAMNYFALACPIMPLGVLGLFMLLDKFGGSYDDAQLQKLQTDETRRQTGELTQAIYIAAMRKKLEAERKRDLDNGLLCSRPLEGLVAPGEKRSAKKKQELSIMLEGKRSEQINGPALLSREQRQTGKLVKQKMQLESHLEMLSQEQDYAAVSRVSARIELLEKALKKLGC